MDLFNKYFSEQKISHKCCLQIRDSTNRRNQWPNIHRMDSLRWVTSPEWFPNQPRESEALLDSAKFQCGHPYGGNWHWELSHTVHSIRRSLSNSPSPAKSTKRDPCLWGIWSGFVHLVFVIQCVPSDPNCNRGIWRIWDPIGLNRGLQLGLYWDWGWLERGWKAPLRKVSIITAAFC